MFKISAYPCESPATKRCPSRSMHNGGILFSVKYCVVIVKVPLVTSRSIGVCTIGHSSELRMGKVKGQLKCQNSETTFVTTESRLVETHSAHFLVLLLFFRLSHGLRCIPIIVPLSCCFPYRPLTSKPDTMLLHLSSKVLTFRF